MKWAHLGRRFFGSIKPGAPDHADEQWAITRLNDGERALWRQMSNPDRRHAIAVAYRVVGELGAKATTPIIVAALLHDVGKIESGFRTPMRVVATFFWAVVPDQVADTWMGESGVRQRLALYRRHPSRGEALLVDAGSDQLTSSWAADHHSNPESWRVPQAVGAVLQASDDD